MLRLIGFRDVVARSNDLFNEVEASWKDDDWIGRKGLVVFEEGRWEGIVTNYERFLLLFVVYRKMFFLESSYSLFRSTIFISQENRV